MITKQIKPKSKDRLATEIRLLDAAEQIFSRHGFQGATTRMIAKKADVNVALIARYFDGKYGLMLKFIEKKAAECRIIIMDYPPQETLSAECINALLKKEKVSPKLETHEIVKIIEDYIFSIVIGKILIHNISVEEANLYIERFIETFCKGVLAKT